MLGRPLRRLPNAEHTEAAILRTFEAGCCAVVGNRRGVAALTHYYQTFYPYYPFRLPPANCHKLEAFNGLTPVDYRRRLAEEVGNLLHQKTPRWVPFSRLAGQLIRLSACLPSAVAHLPVQAERIIMATEHATESVLAGRLTPSRLVLAVHDLVEGALALKPVSPRILGVVLDILKLLDGLERQDAQPAG